MENAKNGWAFEILETDEERLDSYNQTIRYCQCQTNSMACIPNQVASMKSENAKILANKADWLYFKEEYAEAEIYYKKAVEAYGKNVNESVECSYNLAQIYEKQSRFKEAEQLYREIYAITKNLPSKSSLSKLAVSNLAHLCSRSGRKSEAAALYMEVISKTTEDMQYEDIQFIENCLNNFLEIYSNSCKILKVFEFQEKLASMKSRHFGYAL